MSSMSSQYRIIAVCTGNICRSPMAELMLAEAFAAEGLAGAVVVDSAGTTAYEAGRPIDPRAARKLAAHSIASDRHIAREWRPEWFRDRDLILALDVDHYGWLRQAAPDGEVAVADPDAAQFRSGSGRPGPPGPGHRGPLVRRPRGLRPHLGPHQGRRSRNRGACPRGTVLATEPVRRSRYALFHDPCTRDHRHRRPVRRRKNHPGDRACRPAAGAPQGVAVPSGGRLSRAGTGWRRASNGTSPPCWPR